MLHEAILQELLNDEVQVAKDRLKDRAQEIFVVGHDVICVFTMPNGPIHRLRLDAGHFDAEPCRVGFVDDQNRPLPGSAWPPGLNHGEHPVLGGPFVCTQGTYEYHCHTSHLGDSWDRYRYRIRIPNLLDHILERCRR